MSIKIYDGLIAVDADVFTVATRIREVLEPAFLEKYRELHEILEELPQGSTWNDFPQGIFSGDDVAHDFKLYDKIEELDRSKTWTFSKADIIYHVCLIPNMAGGNPLVMVFGDKSKEYIELLIASGVVKEYGYWDNSDYPDDVTQEDWKLRKKAWSAILDKAPSEAGTGFDSPGNIQSQMSVIPKWPSS